MRNFLLFISALSVAALTMAQTAPIVSEVSLEKGAVTANCQLKSAVQVAYPSRLSPIGKAEPRGAVSRIEDIAGSYLMYFDTAVSNTVIDYNEVTVAKKDATHVTIDGFWVNSASTLTAEVNLSDGTISIPSQMVYVSSTYGECDLAPWYRDEETGAIVPVRSVAIPGVIENGQIILNSYAWGVFINSGEHKDQFMMLGLRTEFSPVNGEDETARLSDGTKTRNAVAITQQDNTVTVKNFAGYGREVTIDVAADMMNVSVPRQAVYSYYDNSSSSVVSYECYTITEDGYVDPNADIAGIITKNDLTLGKWALLLDKGSGQYSGIAYKSYKLYYTDGTKFAAAAVDGAEADAHAEAVTYYNLQGMASRSPFGGLNIVVETLSDGSRRALKRVF